jgi:S-adenosylmethionine:tRNA ribosyltransferase-isomerase
LFALSDFDFFLPPELIAQEPARRRASSRLLHVGAGGQGLALDDRVFSDLPDLLDPGDLLVLNDTRVIRARLFGQKATGGKVEALLERIFDARHASAQLRSSKSPQPGSTVELGGQAVRVSGRDGDLFLLELEGEGGDFWQLAEAHGRLPLPPYIAHAPKAEDERRYQTVYAREPGAVAAPTAGLHFDEALFVRLAARGIRRATLTLHVGAGTFQPVREENIAEHKMHHERFSIPPETVDAIEETKAQGGRVVAVGTTSLRALEASAEATGRVQAGAGDTGIFITPGFRFQVVDRLITNFHLPKSTLLMLVSAFAGMEAIRRAYAHAVGEKYRFFSYGDAMLLDPEGRGKTQ